MPAELSSAQRESAGARVQWFPVRLRSIKVQLVLLVSTIALPIAGMLGWFLSNDLQKARDDAREKVRILANFAAADLQRHMGQTDLLLGHLAGKAVVQAGGGLACDPFIADFGRMGLRYVSLTVRDLKGEPICKPFAPAEQGSTAELDRRAFVEPASGRWMTQLTKPLLDSSGRAQGSLILQLDLLQLSRELLDMVPKNALVVVLDRQQAIMLRSADAPSFIGRVNPGAAAARGMGSGFSLVSYLDGVSRLNYFLTVPGTDWLLIAAMPEDEVFASYNSMLRRALGFGLAVLAMISWLVWRIGVSVMRPIERLAGTAAAVAVGQKTRRAELSGPAEVVEFAQQFNQMLDARDAVEAELRETSMRTQIILDNMADGVIHIDTQGRIEAFNKAAVSMFGYSAEEVLGRNVSMLMPEPHSSHHDGYLRHYQSTAEARVIGKTRELQGRRRDGTLFSLSLSVSKILHAGQQSYIGLVRDITQSQHNLEEIRRLAFYDALTGLPNRRLLLDRLGHAMLSAGRSGRYGALMFMDLDHFKQLNDSLGHQVGDQLLQQVATRLLACVRETDSVARLGGDEFVVLLESLSSQEAEAALQAEAVAGKMLQAFGRDFDLPQNVYSITASIGIVVFVKDHETKDELLKRADVAMYQAKAAGRNAARFFDPAMQAAAQAHNELERDLRAALSNREFALHYQRQVSVDAQGRSKTIGAEALLRWHCGKRGMVSPAQFIPLAEETGLILPLGVWVLETACAQLTAWAGTPETAAWTVAVNVSARQFKQADFVANVEAALAKTGADPSRLKLELTESMLVDNMDEIIVKMNAIRARGIQFSLDDFGTGYSSLSYLKQLPLTQLKIDQSFVRDLLTDPSDAAIVRTILALGHSLGLTVIAEGVETAEQSALLVELGCEAFQGYYFGRPLPAQQLTAHADASRAS